MKAIRILIYEGSDKWVLNTLSKSLPDEVFRVGDNSITLSSFGTIDLVGVVGSERGRRELDDNRYKT